MSSRSRASGQRLAFEAGIATASRESARTRAFGFLSLFTSVGTLICCALPSLLVLVGLGATVASLLSVAPWLVTLSQHKAWVFAGSGTLIALNFAYVYGLTPRLRDAHQTCRTDDMGRAACAPTDRVTRAVLWISAALYGIGFLTAYALG